VTPRLVEDAMANGEETEAEERQVGIGEDIAPAMRKLTYEEPPSR
jgi:hypothetical protein